VNPENVYVVVAEIDNPSAEDIVGREDTPDFEAGDMSVEVDSHCVIVEVNNMCWGDLRCMRDFHQPLMRLLRNLGV
jgi:hypothetical protein